MILINHQKKVIFIRIPKTGSVYLTLTLLNNYNFTRSINLRDDHDIMLNTEKYSNDKFWGGREINFFNYFRTSQNLSKDLEMNDEKWQTYKKICFVRNPYERIVSGWNFLQEKYDKFTSINYIDYKILPFKEFLKLDPKLVSNNEYIHTFMTQSFNADNIDYIGKLENIENDLENILLDIGFEKNEINHEKQIVNSSYHLDYINYYDDENIQLVNKLFKEDFEKFNYKMVSNLDEFRLVYNNSSNVCKIIDNNVSKDKNMKFKFVIMKDLEPVIRTLGDVNIQSSSDGSFFLSIYFHDCIFSFNNIKIRCLKKINGYIGSDENYILDYNTDNDHMDIIKKNGILNIIGSLDKYNNNPIIFIIDPYLNKKI